MVKFIHPVCGVRQADAAGKMIVDVVADLLRQPLVQRGRMPLQLEDIPGGREVGAIAGRVPGRACCQLVPLEQHHIRPPDPGEVVQRAAADRSATDDDDACVAFQRFTRSLAGS